MGVPPPNRDTCRVWFYPLSVHPETAYPLFFKWERSWDFPFQSFSPTMAWPTSSVVPDSRAGSSGQLQSFPHHGEPCSLCQRLSQQGSLDSPRVSSWRHAPRDPAPHFWAAPLLHFCFGLSTVARCFRVSLSRSPVVSKDHRASRMFLALSVFATRSKDRK